MGLLVVSFIFKRLRFNIFVMVPTYICRYVYFLLSGSSSSPRLTKITRLKREFWVAYDLLSVNRRSFRISKIFIGLMILITCKVMICQRTKSDYTVASDHWIEGRGDIYDE